MTEPRINPDWDSLDFRRRNSVPPRSHGHSSQFSVGVTIFLVTALVYPWYSYWVTSYLAGRDMQAALQVASSEVEKVSQEMQRQLNAAARLDAVPATIPRPESIRVRGTSMIQGQRVAVVVLEGATLAEARATICQQAARSFRQSLSGERLRVQASSGNRPARDVGTVVCD